MCNRQYGQTVPVQVYSHKNRSFSYIPSILRHILFELLKNSMRATVEVHEHDDELPPIKVIISDGDTNADVIMKISDEGGGIQRRNINRIWDYFYTTSTVNAFEKDGTDFGVGDENGCECRWILRCADWAMDCRYPGSMLSTLEGLWKSCRLRDMGQMLICT